MLSLYISRTLKRQDSDSTVLSTTYMTWAGSEELLVEFLRNYQFRGNRSIVYNLDRLRGELITIGVLRQKHLDLFYVRVVTGNQVETF